MSITIHQSPTGYKSAHEEVWHVVESTNKAVTGFQYVFDIYKAGSLVTRVKNTPYGVDKLGVIDLGNIVRAPLDSADFPALDIPNLSTPFELGADVFFTDYNVRYGEVSGGVLTQNIASGTYRVYNSYSRNMWDNKPSDIATNVLLTNRPDIKFYDNEPVVISSYIDAGTSTFEVDFTITRKSASNYFDTSYSNIKKMYVYGFYPPDNADKISLSCAASGVVNAINFQKKCSKYDTHTLIFLNAFGGYDNCTFVHGKLLRDIERKSYDKSKWKIVDNQMSQISNTYIFNEFKKTYATKYIEKMQLTSDILSTIEYDWLAELIVSPQVYYFDKNTLFFYPVLITDTNYEFKDDRINKTETLTVNIEFSGSQNTQFR
jgi:hypothetical protein